MWSREHSRISWTHFYKASSIGCLPSPLGLPGAALLSRGLDALVHVDVATDLPVHSPAARVVGGPGVVRRRGVTLLLLDNLRELNEGVANMTSNSSPCSPRKEPWSTPHHTQSHRPRAPGHRHTPQHLLFRKPKLLMRYLQSQLDPTLEVTSVHGLTVSLQQKCKEIIVTRETMTS